MNKGEAIKELNAKLNPPKELGGVFLPCSATKQFEFMFLGEMPAMKQPKNWDGKSNDNFNITARDFFLQEMMRKYGVAGSYVTDIVKERNTPRRPTVREATKWLPFLRKEIDIIKPKYLIVLGLSTWEKTFEPYIQKAGQVPSSIQSDWVYHYGSRVPRDKFEKRFKEVIRYFQQTRV